MKFSALLFIALLLASHAQSQAIPFDYNVKLNPITISGFNGLHSFAFGQADGKWLLIGGRLDGLHARQPFASFPENMNNTTIYVIDIENAQIWTSTSSSLSISLQEQLQSTNMNFYQDGDSLYILGGYGYSATAADHITYPNLTSIKVSGLINAIITGNPIDSYFKQITDQNFAVTGGHLAKINNEFYLVGGHRFDGRYNPMGNATYVQTYVNGIRKFAIDNSGSQLSISNYSEVIDQVHLHRRDYNLMPQVFPNGELGYTISTGVFQIGIDLPFLYPVDITASGYTPITTFNQYLSHYHSANVAIYDSLNNRMHSLFFGGLSQYTYVNNVLTANNQVPFVKTISRVSRDENGNLEENQFSTEMPALIGSSAEFIPLETVSHYSNDVLKMNTFSQDSILIGHIVGGIYSTQINPFTNNNTSATSANNVIYEVWLQKNASAGNDPINGSNPFSVDVYPNPTKNILTVELNMPAVGDVDLFVTDVSGKIVWKKYFKSLNEGNQKLDLTNQFNFAPGVYNFNFINDGKFNYIHKVVIE